jgi:hypothetical protein
MVVFAVLARVTLSRANGSKDKNLLSTKTLTKDVNVDIKMSHGPVKDGLAAFLICERKQFRIGQPIPVLYGVVYGGPEKHITIQAPYPAWEPNLVSWFSITGPDGKEISYMGPRPKPIQLNSKNTLQLWRHGFCGIDWPDVRWSYKLGTPGTYRFKWNYKIGSGPGGSWWVGHLISNEIKIEVVP